MKSNPTIIVESGALSRIAQIFEKHWPGSTPLIVADRNTFLAAGKAVKAQFVTDNTTVELLVFEDKKQVHPDYEHVMLVKQRLQAISQTIAIAVGSGSINDIVKLASYELDRSYACVPTAPSVDGYTSSNAPITINGFKKTIPCAPPMVVLADVDVLKEAPLWLISSGYGDLVAKVAGGGDWIIADSLGIEKIDSEVWDFVQAPLRKRISQPGAIVNRESAVIDQLFSGLVETGIAMKRFGNSRPASGGEHLLSHVWEMLGITFDGQDVSHGFKVAIGTLITTAMMSLISELSWKDVQLKWSISQGPNAEPGWEEQLERLLGEDIEGEVLSIARGKQLTDENLQGRRALIASQWESIGRRLTDQLIPFKQLQRMLQDAACPTEPADIALDRGTVAYAMRKARVIRPRYTVFDLAYECGILEYMIEQVVYTDRYFSCFSER